MLGCPAIPLLGLKIILSHALPVFVRVGNLIFRGRGSMSRGFVQPSQSFWKVLLNDAAFKIEQAQLVLRWSVVLRDRFVIPLDRLIGIDRHASALRVHETQVRLRGSVTLIGSSLIQGTGSWAFAGAPPPGAILEAHIILRGQITFPGCS